MIRKTFFCVWGHSWRTRINLQHNSCNFIMTIPDVWPIALSRFSSPSLVDFLSRVFTHCYFCFYECWCGVKCRIRFSSTELNDIHSLCPYTSAHTNVFFIDCQHSTDVVDSFFKCNSLCNIHVHLRYSHIICNRLNRNHIFSHFCFGLLDDLLMVYSLCASTSTTVSVNHLWLYESF